MSWQNQQAAPSFREWNIMTPSGESCPVIPKDQVFPLTM
jgi:hypothetical protein